MMLRIKIVIIGDGGVGKTSLIRRYLGYGFNPQYLKTIGANFYSKKIVYSDEKVNKLPVQLVVWDLAGQPRFNEVRSVYYRGAKAAIVVFDITNRKSFDNVKNWVKEFWKNMNEKLPIVLVGNKIDLIENQSDIDHIKTEEGLKLAENLSREFSLKIPYLETSAKIGKHVEDVFKEAIRMVLDYYIKKKKEKS